MKIYSIMSGANFEGGAYSSEWIMCWIGLLVIVVLFMVCKKWLGEEEAAGMSYNWLGSLLGFLVWMIVVSLTGAAKWSLLAGVAGLFAGGFAGGRFIQNG